MKHSNLIQLCSLLVAVSFLGSRAEARVTRIDVTTREVVLDGMPFGETGPYEKLRGTVHFEVDPFDPRNGVVFDIDKAPRNQNGMVEFAADFYILKPVDLGKGNGALLYEVNNHGNKQMIFYLNNSLSIGNDLSVATDFGDGFLMRRGYTVAWVGWEALIQAGDNRMTVQFPIAMEHNQPINERVLVEFPDGQGASVDPVYTRPLSGNPASRSYAAFSTDPVEAEAELRVRPSDSPRPPAPDIPDGEVVPIGQWSFARCPNGPPGTPSTTDICLAAGFRNDQVYQLIYKATNAPVSGLGHITTRDFLAFVRNDKADDVGHPNDLSGLDTILCVGASQSGKYLRDFIYQGFNEDEEGRRVCDGVHITVAGAERVALNYRFAASFKAANPHAFRPVPSEAFPRSYAIRPNPIFPEIQDGILKRPTTDPKVFHSDTSYEYRIAHASLVDTDEAATEDLEQPANVRRYVFSALEHSAGGPSRGPEVPGNYGIGNRECQQQSNPTQYGIFARALLVALEQWVRQDIAPPESQAPSIKNGTLVTADEYCGEFPRIPGVACNGLFNASGERDFGPRVQSSRGVIDYLIPHVLSEHRNLVPKADELGNDIGGIRHPYVEAPIATLTGWNLRRPEFGEGELCALVGMKVPLPKTLAEGLKTGDPRPSLEELYGDHNGYVEAVATAAFNLWSQRFMLLEDVFQTIHEADDSDVLR